MKVENFMITTSIKTLNEFLSRNNIDLNCLKFLKNHIENPKHLAELPTDIIDSIIMDAYDSSNKILRIIVNQLEQKYDILIGRLLKILLKKYLDYQFDEDFKKFLNYFKNYNGKAKEEELKKLIERHLNSKEYEIARVNSIHKFKTNLQKAILDNKERRIFDYLNFIYSRLLNFNELNKISLSNLFEENVIQINQELEPQEQKLLREFCDSGELYKRELIIKKFNEKYIDILEKRNHYEQKASIAILNITEDLFNKFPSKEGFYSYLFLLIKKLYSIIRNHRVLAIKIENIIFDNINIKWEIFAYLSIFAEKFLKQPETRAYYKPDEIFKDTVNFLYNLEIKSEELELIKKFYKGNADLNDLENLALSQIEKINDVLDDFKYIYTGFTFNECFILRYTDSFKANTEELKFIVNKNEVLLIFSKHKFNDSKIPCPICGSLKISGNSYPKVGIRSWECKNPLCGERSKTNRGKRYSERTIFMQDSITDLAPENLIQKSMIKKWRKDIVNIDNVDEIYKMLIKYYSYKDDSIIVINLDELESDLILNLEKYAEKNVRNLKFLSPFHIIEFPENPDSERELFDEFYNSKKFSYINHFISNPFIIIENNHYNEEKFKFIYLANNKIKLVQGDCYKIMQNFRYNYIDCMVTSPPYYNAREYSQWTNLYSFLNNIYKIALVSNHILKAGGVFVFNIGDIYGNPNTTVKSKMGEKRILLGSYIILLFLKAGFDLLENFIWNKGEPQSQRHKNDGIFTPYYQKPTNCYEHIFIFKKKGAPLKLNKNLKENPWKDNIPKFSPVIKIDTNGENRYGHTAPFPPNIPEFACKCFTNENEIILDPFSGSSTTAIEACRNNRIGVGIEILEKYLKLSIERANEINLDIEVFNIETDEFKTFNKNKKDKSHCQNLDQFIESNKIDDGSEKREKQNSLDLYL